MRKSLLSLTLLAAALTACQNDDTDFSAYTSGDATSASVVRITWTDSGASVSGDDNGYVSISGTDVTVNTGSASDSLLLVLSGSCSDGSLLIYRQRKFGIRLDGLTLTNDDGPAINNQCGKSLYIECASGTTNTLTDGTAYAEQTIDQKGTLFSEGQIYLLGSGTLSVNGNYKNAIASDDYITILGDITLNAATSTTGTNGIKANDGIFILGGTTTVSVESDGGRGIRSEAQTVIGGGTTTITTTGDCKIETTDGITDTTSCACIKSDSLFTMTAGTLTVTSTGDGGKGINCSQNIEVSGGTLTATTTGSNDMGKPKAVKSDTGIIVSGGSFTASVRKSWACDNGYESNDEADQAANCVTIVGTPVTQSLAKKSVVIEF